MNSEDKNTSRKIGPTSTANDCVGKDGALTSDTKNKSQKEGFELNETAPGKPNPKQPGRSMTDGNSSAEPTHIGRTQSTTNSQ